MNRAVNHSRVALLILAIFFIVGCRQQDSPVSSWGYLSPAFQVEKKYQSMEGPGHVQSGLTIGREPELVWLTGFRARITDSEGKKQHDQGLMCHNTLLLGDQGDRLRPYRDGEPPLTIRLFTIAQGQIEMAFPAGFGLPVPANAPLTLHSQILNTDESNIGVRVAHDIRTTYIRDSELKQPMKPLLLVEANAYVAEDEASAQLNRCSMAQAAPGAMRPGLEDTQIAGHWVVPPGRQVNKTDITRQLGVPFDTTIHYGAVHLHPYAEKVEIWDRTDDRLVLELTASTSTDGERLETVSHFESEEGTAILADHEYELVTTYNNTGQEPVTAMSILFLYCLDKSFGPPSKDSPSRSDAELPSLIDDFCGAPAPQQRDSSPEK